MGPGERCAGHARGRAVGLKYVDDARRWRELAGLSANLLKAAQAAPEGRRIHVDQRELPTGPPL